MAFRATADTRSRASLGGHPIHPFLVPFPIAFLATAAATDLLYVGTREAAWAGTSRWLLRAGVVGASIAAPFGLTDFLTIPESRRTAAGWVHVGGNVAVLGLASANLALRRHRPARAIFPTGILLSIAAAGLLAVTAWQGGELAYRQGIGVSLEGDREPPAEPERLTEARRRGRRRASRIDEGAGMPVMAPGTSGTPSPDLVALRELPETLDEE